MTVKEFALPDLGEGLTESEVVAWRVAVGDAVQLNQVIAEVETAKALVEVPSPYAGVVCELYAEPGQTLQVGAPLVAFEVADAGAPADSGPSASPAEGPGDGTEPAAASAAADGPEESATPAAAEPSQTQEVLVGRIPVSGAARPHRRPRTGRLAEPIVRERAIHTTATTPAPRAAGGETRTMATGVRRRTAEAMVRSAAVPQVTEFLTVDVTRGIRLLDRLTASPEFRDRRVGVLALAARALTLALARTPEANTRWDDETGELVDPGTVNLGIAVATARGLVVPNIRGAERLGLAALADALASLVERARAGRSTPAELTGGTITITNVGVFGVDAGTPLLNPGETAILALGTVARRPWEHRGRVRLRRVMTLSLTFDHRVIDGEQGSRLLSDVGLLLADPAQALASVMPGGGHGD